MWRSIFISVYIAYLFLALTWSVLSYTGSVGDVGWYASIVAQSIYLIWFLYLRTLRLKNASFASIMVTASGGAATLIAAGHFAIVDRVNGVPLALAAISFFGWLVYHLAYCHFGRYRGSLKAGDQLPKGDLIAYDGKVIPTDQLRFPAVLICHEGKWNPFATDQLRELFSAHLEFSSRDIHLYAVSTQDATDRWEGRITELSDPKGEWVNTIGILGKNRLPLGLTIAGYRSDVPEAFAIIVGADGKIVATHKPADSRKRPSADFFLRYFQK